MVVLTVLVSYDQIIVKHGKNTITQKLCILRDTNPDYNV